MTDIAKTTNSYLDELNDIQYQAVTTLQGPVMVIAGPGSGKTRVLTYRIAHLINNGVAPWQILALTFTNKAAREMKHRIEKVVGQRANRIWAGTFHSLFARILRVEAHRIDFPNDFTIYDSDDSKSLIKQIVKSLSLDPKTYNPSSILYRISSAKSNLITPKIYAQDQELMNYDSMKRMPMLHRIYDSYVKKCHRSGVMDFDDLLLQTFKLLYENADNVKEKYRNQFQYLMVDEFQDTNLLQYAILKQLVKYDESPENICIVGDDSQSIYSFRGATIENILQFEEDFKNVVTFKLEQNYRSQKNIVTAANGIIQFNQRRIEKNIWTEKESDHKIKIVKTTSDTEEGKRVADLIIEQKNRYGIENKDIAILYRTNAQSRIFEEYLRRFNIPYRIYGGLSFYQRKEIKDAIAYLRLIVNHNDDEAFKRVVNFPKRGIGQTTLNKIIQFANDNVFSFWESMPHVQLSKSATDKLSDFAKVIIRAKQKNNEADAFQTALYILKRSGLYDHYKSDISADGIRRFENISSLLDGIQSFVEDDEIHEDNVENDKSLSKYLQNIALLTDADNDKNSDRVVTLMSAHAAKGLEFKSVFVVGLEENLFPSFLALSDPRQIDEERRLFYVAITRAEEFLTLTYSKTRYQYGQIRQNDVSRFIEELPAECVDNLVPINSKPTFGTPKILGNFNSYNKSESKKYDIVPTDTNMIKEGMTVIHGRFGEGRVLKIDEARIATIFFEEVYDQKEKRISLPHAKLQILEAH